MYTTSAPVCIASVKTEVKHTVVHSGLGSLNCERNYIDSRTRCTMDNLKYCGKVRRNSEGETPGNSPVSPRDRLYNAQYSIPRINTAKRGSKRSKVNRKSVLFASSHYYSALSSIQSAAIGETGNKNELAIIQEEPQTDASDRVLDVQVQNESKTEQVDSGEKFLASAKSEEAHDNSGLPNRSSKPERDQLLTYEELCTQVTDLFKAEKEGEAWNNSYDEEKRSILSYARKRRTGKT